MSPELPDEPPRPDFFQDRIFRVMYVLAAIFILIIVVYVIVK